MKYYLDFILKRPKSVIAFLIAITLVMLIGITNLEFENSEESAMPEGDPTYLLGEKAKKMFVDSGTYILTAIEPSEGKSLLSCEAFSHINMLIEEIAEYKKFDRAKEDERLHNLLTATGVTVSNPGADKTSENAVAPSGEKYRKPIRPRHSYNYSECRAVSLDRLYELLDDLGDRQLDTIVALRKMKDVPRSTPLSKGGITDIIESWEDLYLYKSIEIIKVSSDPINITDISGADDTLKTVRLIEKDENGKVVLPKTEAEFQKYKKKLFANPSFENNYYSVNDKGEVRALSISFMLRQQKTYDRFVDYLWEMIEKYNHKPVKLLTQGSLVFNKFINEYNANDLEKYMPVVLIIVLITFLLNFRSGRGVVLPVLTVSMGTIWTMGTMGFLGMKMTIVTTIIPPLLMAIGSSYSIHIFNQYLLDLGLIHQKGKREGLKEAVLHISNTVFLTGLTTFISFLTLTVNRVVALREFGIISAVGTLYSVIVSVSLIPTALLLMKTLAVKETSDGQLERRPNMVVLKSVKFFSRLSRHHYKAVVSLVVLSCIICTIGITKMRAETSATTYFHPDSYIRTSLERTNQLFKGSYIVNIIFSPGEGKSIIDADFLNYIENIRLWMDKPEQLKDYRILMSSGFNDYIKKMNMVMNNDDLGKYTIPKDTMVINDYMELFSSDDEDFDGRPDIFESVISRDYNKTNLFVRLGTMGKETMSSRKVEITVNHIRDYLNSIPNPNGYTYDIVGGPVNFVIVSKHIVDGQIKTIFLSLFIIGIIMFLLFRNIKAGLVSLLPVSATIFWIFGFMGFADIPLGMSEALIGVIAIGIGIDDTIHFMNTLRKKLDQGYPLAEAIKATHEEAGLAIVYTSVAIVFGFSVLIFSHFIPVFRSGVLVSGVMIASTLADLVLLPSIIMTFKVRINEVKDWQIFRYIPLHRMLIKFTPPTEDPEAA